MYDYDFNLYYITYFYYIILFYILLYIIYYIILFVISGIQTRKLKGWYVTVS